MRHHRPVTADPDAGPTRELLARLETAVLPSMRAGDLPVRKRAPAHRRLAKAGRIPPEVETEIERFVIAWEMVEGGAHAEGEGGDGTQTREAVFAASCQRLRRARERAGTGAIMLTVATCVECIPPSRIALLGGLAAEPTEAQDFEAWQRGAREALDAALVPVLWRVSGIPPAEVKK